MKEKISIKNIIIGTSLMSTLVILVFFDYQRVQKDFRNLKVQLTEIRLETLVKNKPIVVKFKGKEMSIIDFKTNRILDSMEFSTLNDVMYDTKLGQDTIVFHGGTTNLFNTRIHGGEILLKSWLGFNKYIHVNCAGYVREGRYPED
ncbi:MAG: hypothetical protein K8S18_11945 [Desulfobacula sp.]|nr:hypothetical protein [Desulfobacula sp.]